MRWSALLDKEEKAQLFARKHVVVPIIQPKLLGKVDINTHITNLSPQRRRLVATLNPPLNTIFLRVQGGPRVGIMATLPLPSRAREGHQIRLPSPPMSTPPPGGPVAK